MNISHVLTQTLMIFHSVPPSNHWALKQVSTVWRVVCDMSGCFINRHLFTHGPNIQTDLLIMQIRSGDPSYKNATVGLLETQWSHYYSHSTTIWNTNWMFALTSRQIQYLVDFYHRPILTVILAYGCESDFYSDFSLNSKSTAILKISPTCWKMHSQYNVSVISWIQKLKIKPF